MRWFFGLLIAAAFTLPSQLKYNANVTGSVSRKMADKLGDVVSTLDFNGADVCARIVQAIAAVGSGGVIHAEMDRNTNTCAAGVTISTAGITIYMPSQQLNMGANQWIVTPGTHNVTLIGASSFGVASLSAATGTSIVYTGTGAAITVGDGTTDTWGFLMQDVAIGIGTAGTAAIGIQLNRCGRFQLYRQRIELMIPANTQKGIDLEGFTNYTGGLIYHPWISNGGTAIYFGKNANWNEVVAGDFPMTATGTGIALQFAGAVGGLADGNFVYGADAENCLRPMDFDYSSNNQVFGLRSEACTTLVTLSANSVQNQISTNGTTSGITDSGTNNAIHTTANPIFTQTLWNLKNVTNAASELRLGAGLNAAQFIYLTYNKYDGTTQWQWVKDTSEILYLQHSTTGVNRFIAGAAHTSLNSDGTGSVLLNVDSGTGGTYFGNGSGGLPARIDSTGKVAIYNNITAVGNGVPSLHGATVALTAQTANLAATNVYASAPAGEYRVCANARTTTSGSGTTANLNIIWTDEGGVKTDAVGTWALNSVTVTGQINKCEFIHAAAATAIQVSTTAGTYGTSVYAISAQVERLQ